MPSVPELIEQLRIATAELRDKRTVARHIQDEVVTAQIRVDMLQDELEQEITRLVDPSRLMVHSDG